MGRFSESRLLTPAYFVASFFRHGGVKALLGAASTGGVGLLVEQTVSQVAQTDATLGAGSSNFSAAIMTAWALGLGIYTIVKSSEGIAGAISDVRDRAYRAGRRSSR